MIRRFWVFIHRWAGLTMAGFLIVVGLTGSLLAFWLELNHWLTPELYPGPHPGIVLDAATLARRAEAIAPEARANGVFLGYPGTVWVGVEARPSVPALDYGTICLDPVTGKELGRIKWGGLPQTLTGIMPFIYRLHENLAAGAIGAWILGVTALVWTIDCFIAFYLTLPLRRQTSGKRFFARWKRAFLVKWSASAFRINFDLHRASGLWLWAMLLVFAWSSVFLNLHGVYTRATNLVLDYEPPVWMWPAQPPRDDGAKPLEWEEAQAIGMRLMEEQARAHGFTIERPDALYIEREKGLVEYRARSSRDIGDKAGSTAILFDAYTGELLTLSLPTGQWSGNTLTTWLFELHMADLFGLPYKIFVCVLGLVITMLSVTGIYIWWKKRRARKLSASRRGEAVEATLAEIAE